MGLINFLITLMGACLILAPTQIILEDLDVDIRDLEWLWVLLGIIGGWITYEVFIRGEVGWMTLIKGVIYLLICVGVWFRKRGN